jgi:hypothetical protein
MRQMKGERSDSKKKITSLDRAANMTHIAGVAGGFKSGLIDPGYAGFNSAKEVIRCLMVQQEGRTSPFGDAQLGVYKRHRGKPDSVDDMRAFRFAAGKREFHFLNGSAFRPLTMS